MHLVRLLALPVFYHIVIPWLVQKISVAAVPETHTTGELKGCRRRTHNMCQAVIALRLLEVTLNSGHRAREGDRGLEMPQALKIILLNA